MSDNHGWMAGLFDERLWDAPQDQGLDCAGPAPLDASQWAGAGCQDPTCMHIGTFPRQWELDRHVRACHTGLKNFACPYSGCFNGAQVSAFARPDKLTAHIKASHRHHAERLLDCPAAGCPHVQLKLVDLAVHVREDHLVDTKPRKQKERCGDEVEILRAVANAAPAKDGGS